MKVAKRVLNAPSGPVVLKVSLPQSLYCVAVHPNGEDVVLGGAEGYLALFSIRCESELYKLRGISRYYSLRCNLYCDTANRQRWRRWNHLGLETAGLWSRATGGIKIVRHERASRSLVLITDGRWLVFGDSKEWLIECSSRTGAIRCKWRGLEDEVRSLAIRQQDGMIVSRSLDGTIGRWKSTTGQEIGSRIGVKWRRYFSLAVSLD